MKPDILILRPEPGASRTAAKARAMGLGAVAAPLFEIVPTLWGSPAPELFDGLLLTSANAARHAGPGLAAFTHLPCYAVGEATAAAALERGFTHIIAGNADGSALLERMARDGPKRIFHPCGQEHIPIDHDKIAIERRIVYAAEAKDRLPVDAMAAIRKNALVLLHSPRAGALFAQLTDQAGIERGNIGILAMSEAAAAAAGDGWKMKAAAAEPRDDALLELAVRLCKNGGGRYEGKE